ncbi:MAG: hypothetical protein J6K12_05365 [Clostridia bacterium]|nr:hypothetical protein [Clostridia bacterium]
MPEFSGFEKDDNRIKDVGTIENCVNTLLTLRKRKDRSYLFHIIYALLACVVAYVAMDGIAVGLDMLICSVCFFAVPAIYVYTLLYSPNIIKFMCVVLPLGAYALRFTLYRLKGEDFLSAASTFIGFFMCLAVATVMVGTVLNKNTKLWCFVAVTVCCAVCFMAMGAVFAVYKYGTLDLALILEKLNGAIEQASISFRDTLSQEFSRSETFESFKVAIPDVADMSADEAATYFSKTLKTALSVLKTLIPGMFILVCMIYSFIFVLAFSLSARIHKIPLFVCIMDSRWSYRIPLSCVTFFDIVLLFVIIASIFGLPANISAAVMNLLIILVPVVLIAAFKAAYFFLSVKLRSKIWAVVLCAAIGAFAGMFLGMWGYLMLCSIGVSLVAHKHRIECVLAKEKIMHDTETMLILCGCKQIKASENTSCQAHTQQEDTLNSETQNNDNNNKDK